MAIHFETLSSVEQIEKEVWNSLAETAAPMMEWEYFLCLEKSGVASPSNGYWAQHVVACIDGDPVAIAPLYERNRASVEFGDGGLIQFLSDATGLPYYLGLSGLIPFTPVPGYQFLCHKDLDYIKLTRNLLEYVDYLCHTNNFLTSRLCFLQPPDPRVHQLLMEKGYICIKSEHCMWFNQGYRSFDDYLGTFRSDRRHKIRRELRDIEKQGIEVKIIKGSQVTSEHYVEMYELYTNTWRKHMGPHIRPFLNKTFFQLLGKHFSHRCIFSIASREGRRLGMAIFYAKGARLYGRYWGSFVRIPFLHFATCYYYPIMYAIDEKIEIVDPGFGGVHKIYRGFQVTQASHYVKFQGADSSALAHAIIAKLRARSPSTFVSPPSGRRPLP